jgi:hypothetical protein
MRATAALAIAALALALGACSGKKRIGRDKDAAPAAVKVDTAQGGAPVAAVDEKEPNATPAEATPLALGGTARGSLDGAADVDVYKLAVTGNGALKVTLAGVDGVDLLLEITDGSDAIVAKSDHGPAATGEGVPNLGVVKGDYFLRVKEFTKPAKAGKKKKGAEATKERGGGGGPSGSAGGAGAASPRGNDAAPAGRTGPSPTYELTAVLAEKPVEGGEREPDDDAGAANEMYPGDTVTGFVGWTGDKDVWKLSLEAMTQRNAFDVEVTPVDGVALNVEIADAAGKALQARKGGKGATVALNAFTPQLAEGSAPFHYITIGGDRSNPDAGYSLTVRGRLVGLDEETEPNDKKEQAQLLPGSSGTVKAGYAAGDVDCFAVEAAPEAQSLVFTVSPPDGVDAVVEVSVPSGLLAKTDLAAAGANEKVEVTIPASVRGTACVAWKAVKADPGTPRDYDVDYSVETAVDALPPEE